MERSNTGIENQLGWFVRMYAVLRDSERQRITWRWLKISKIMHKNHYNLLDSIFLLLFLDNIMWLSVENIQEKDADTTIISDLPDLPHLVGSGQSVGGVVSETVGAGSVNENTPLQVRVRF